ncbi:hypothetical protein GCM10012290_01380 [Halolactibacillus alkaliphilus]|uniref:Transposase IS204/IS1001/IS1096/IS1165 DDE domain-containing protein n=1 Tax=Halolactibacillus alkaliphilus TaxID=442899 RepID=A0A511WX60_9BACI|nr:hypothetical protein HAL01_00010 [Halolactibacillus alkaliphilus]GGN64183.1 hypothetical protein GCM10012290_01380 [Halolactibacillus alkaliphilus]SFO61730.1 Transposase [Halolactibacillus alkaliphilus]
MLDYFDELKANYDLLRCFFKVFDDRNFDDLKEIVKEKLDANISSYMKSSIKTLCEHLPHIQNNFNYTYNNGRIEGINNKIKVLNRVTYGYRNFKNYKSRILLRKNQLNQGRKSHKIKHMFQLHKISLNL